MSSGDFIVYLVVNCSRVEMVDIENPDAGAIIPTPDKPKFLHSDLDKAQNELLRLQSHFPDEEFLLFQSVCEAVKITGTKHYRIKEFNPQRGGV